MDKIFAGKSVTIIAGGPSLKDFDFNRVRGDVVCVNNACYNSTSTMIVALDNNFYVQDETFFDNYKGVILTDRDCIRKEAKRITYSAKGPDGVHFDWYMQKANLSGFVALGAVLYLGAERVLLLGFDGGGFTGKEECANHYPNDRPIPECNYYSKNEYFDIFKDKAIILNFGMASKIESFQKLSLSAYGT